MFKLQRKRLSDYHVTEILEQWGRWSNSGVGTGGLGESTEDNSHWISDDEGLRIDRSIAKLGVADSVKVQMGKIRGKERSRITNRKHAIELFYLKGYNYPMVASALKVGENKAIVVLNSAEAYIECDLDLLEVV